MALPYKLLKTITIDGETMGLDPDLGIEHSTSKDRTSTGSWSYVLTDEVTILESGMYLITLEADYSVFTDTGNAVCESAIRRNGANLVYSIFYTYGGTGNRHTTPFFTALNAGDKIRGASQSSVGCQIAMNLKIVKLITMQ